MYNWHGVWVPCSDPLMYIYIYIYNFNYVLLELPSYFFELYYIYLFGIIKHSFPALPLKHIASRKTIIKLLFDNEKHTDETILHRYLYTYIYS